MLLMPKASSNLLASSAALLGLLCVPMAVRAEPSAPHPRHAAPVEAQYRGCESTGWCRFWIEPRKPFEESVHRVRPEGLGRLRDDDAVSIAMRDRAARKLCPPAQTHRALRPARTGRWNVRGNGDRERVGPALGPHPAGIDREGRRSGQVSAALCFFRKHRTKKSGGRSGRRIG